MTISLEKWEKYRDVKYEAILLKNSSRTYNFL